MEKWGLAAFLLLLLTLFLIRRPSASEPAPVIGKPVSDWERFRRAVESVYPPVAPDLVAAMWTVGVPEGQDPYLLAAIAWQESSFRLDAVGQAGEQGAYQLTEVALQDVVNRANPDGRLQFLPHLLKDPEYATLVAARYLGLLQGVYMRAYGTPDQVSRAGGREALVLAWYNGGPGRLLPASLQYANRVLERREELKRRGGR